MKRRLGRPKKRLKFQKIPFVRFYTQSNPVCDFQLVLKDFFAAYEDEQKYNKLVSRGNLDKYKQILIKRYREGLILEEIAKDYNITRERVRQIQSVVSSNLKDLITKGSCNKPALKLNENSLLMFKNFMTYLSSRTFHIENELKGHINKDYDLYVPDFLIDSLLPILTGILGYHKCNVNGNTFYLKGSTFKNKVKVQNMLSKMRRFLEDKIFSVSAEKISKKLKLSEDDAKTLVESSGMTLKTCEGKYRLLPEYFYNKLNLAYRILYENGKPMDQDLLYKMTYGGDGSQKNYMGGRIANDSRIKSVGKTGLCSLTEWGTDCRTNKEIMIDLLKNAKRPLTVKQITQGFSKLGRKVKSGSIISYSRFFPDCFMRINGGKIALANWKQYKKEEVKTKKQENVLTKGLVFEELKNLLTSRHKTLRSTDFYKYIRNKYGDVRPMNIYTKAIKCPFIDILPDGGASKYRLKSNYKEQMQLLKKKEKDKYKNSMTGIRDEAIKIISRKPSRMMSLSDLVKNIDKNKSRKPTVYRALEDGPFNIIKVKGKRKKLIKINI